MAGFLGSRVQLILNQPPNTEVQGIVKDIVAGQTLSLINVYVPQTATQLDALTVQSAAIADIKILSAPQDPSPPPQHNTDPAILSYDRTRPHQSARPVPAASLPIRANDVASLPERNQHAPVYAEPIDNTPGSVPREEVSKKRSRQPKQKLQTHPQATQEALPVLDLEVSRNGNAMNNTVKRGKGWRETPLLQPTQAPAKQKTRNRKHKQGEGDAQNGWATEDATDIQDMGEFDFEANHKLFDKQQVWDDLRKGDTTADEDRLVSHNKLATRKNLLPSENVLSPKLETDDKGSDADTEVDFPAGRSSSRHSVVRGQQSRSNSGFAEVKADRHATRSGTSRTGRPLPVSTTSTLKAGRNFSPHSIASTSVTKRTNTTRTGRRESTPTVAGLVLDQTKAACPTLYPSALDLLEKEACSRYGLPVEAVDENAARGIAEQAVSMIESSSEPRRGSRVTTSKLGMSSSGHGFENTPPVIVVLAGDHLISSRALGAVRHLSSRGYKVIVAECSWTSMQNEQYTKQVSIIKKMMRAGASIKRGTWSKASEYIKNLNGPPVVIIDALLSGSKYEDVLERSEDLSEDIRKMIDWANRSRAPVLSVTCPSGLSDHDGSATIVDGEPLAVRADKLVVLGAPVTGVLEALKLGERFDVSLADIGINIALKADDAVNFGAQWLSPLTYVAESDA